MNIALIQMKVSAENDENIDRALSKIKKAAQSGVDMAVLPEMFCCPYETANFKVYAQPQSGENVLKLSKAAKENNIYLVAGSMPEIDGGKIYNTSYVFDRSGNMIAKHRKSHLFDVDIVGGQRFFESETLTAGDQITVFDTEFGKFGLAICFDLRFSEIAKIMSLEGAKGIIVPAAFNMTTGPAHWEVLFRSRAIDNQLFTVGVAPARDLSASYHSYANSIIVSPWGEVLARLGEAEEELYYELNLNLVEEIRKQLPIISARRTDLYKIDRCSED